MNSITKQKIVMKKLSLSAMLLALLFTACKKDKNTEELEKFQPKFEIEHTIGSEELKTDSTWYTHPAGHQYRVTKLEYFISDVILVGANGVEYVVSENPHLVDISNESTFSFTSALEVEEVTISGVRLTFGIDSVKNTSNSLSSIEEQEMAWPEMMGGGYHYMKFEGVYDSLATSTLKNFKTHTGPTGGRSNEIDIEVSGNWTINSSSTIVFSMDFNEFYQNPEVYNFDTYGMAIMGNQNAQSKLKNNGTDILSIEFK